jgi:two-component system sensor histidine kinase MtrB
MMRRARRTKRRLPLRSRIMVFFTLSILATALLVSIIGFVAGRTWTRDSHRDDSLRRTRENAAYIRNSLAPNAILLETLRNLSSNSSILVQSTDTWITNDTRFENDDIPADALAVVAQGGEYFVHSVIVDGLKRSLVGVPTLGSLRTEDPHLAVWEFIPLDGYHSTIRNLTFALLLGAVATVTVGAVTGVFAVRRMTRPLNEVARAARILADGDLDTRLPASQDPDVSQLTATFNDMADALSARLRVDARFNSDVSHELRSPLTTLNASVAVLRARRSELSPSNQAALDLLTADLQRFTRLVDDLLEISRFDGKIASLVLNDVGVAEFVREVGNATHREDLQVVVSPLLQIIEMEVDKRRLARVITNLIDNAHAHGRPPVTLSAIEFPPGDIDPAFIRITVEDRGDGVDLARADELFERFNRGPAANRTEGSGLGLALAREHVKLHGGTIEFVAPPRGVTGTRIVVLLPLRQNRRDTPMPDIEAVDTVIP